MALRKRQPVLGQANATTFLGVREFDIDEVSAHPLNPNVGDVDEIAESIGANGYYKPTVVVNVRNGMIAAGTHTWLALRRLGWTRFQATVIDVDDDSHLRILAVDNATAAKGERDMDTLARLLRELEDGQGTFGTGYSPDEVERIIATNDANLAAARTAITSLETGKKVTRAAADVGFDEVDVDDAMPDVAIPEPVIAGVTAVDDDFEQASPDLGVFSLKPDIVFDGMVGDWGLPELKPGMIADFDELPQNVLAWAGSATRDWLDPDQWWVYNYGVDSTGGMNDLTKMILGFYVFDEYFEKWWLEPHKWVGRAFNTGIQYAITPDFSMHTPGVESRVLSLWNLYRSRWLGRYFQEAGIRIIPNVSWGGHDEAFLTDHVLATLPVGLGSIAMQLQATYSQSRDKAAVADESDRLAAQIQTVFDTLKPKGALIYYGKAGRELVEAKVIPGCPILWVESRVNRLSERAKTRNRKKTTL
jgi:hypothetical protein